jgi:segregation and condensation protein A
VICLDKTFKINDFEGPLDLLLHLIKDNKMSIFDIEIATITTQYLEIIEDAKNINLEIASDFLVMASTLLEIKSKSLLPKSEVEIDDEYEEGSQDELVRRLLEYKRYKEISEELKEFNETRNLIYTKPLEDLSHYKKTESVSDLAGDVELYDLIRTMDKMMQRLKFKKPLSSIMENSELSVEERCVTLLEQINTKKEKKVLLDDLIDVPTKSYLIVTFLALLDLSKRNKVRISQDKTFDKVYIKGVI